MRKRYAVSLLSPLLLSLPGCRKTDAPMAERVAVPAQLSSIVIDIGEGPTVLHDAKTGQTLVWRSTTPSTPHFWIEFKGKSPCASGALVLPGSITKAASCVVGPSAGSDGMGRYHYSIRTTSPSLPPSGPTADRIVRCIGCNN